MDERLDRTCPCGSGDPCRACCGRYLTGLGEGGAAPTAAALMRSRYTAFALGDVEHPSATWHPSTRPADLHLDDDTRWLHSSVGPTTGGGPFDRAGTVEFTAVFRGPDGRGELREHSRFVKENGRWLYVDGDVGVV
ncbi:MAG: YchJ family metal-binding protein [Gordonia sp. (in: high G+C Gram-positive bacteria)]|uniref:YchJ family protein n=1 Tax=Gordonia sp. (in: high G+C Gram-positive bacteria) TaxID=84139 RepID=UPI0039E3941B